MPMDGVVADEKPVGDGLVVEAFSHEAQDLDFAFRQPAISGLRLRLPNRRR